MPRQKQPIHVRAWSVVWVCVLALGVVVMLFSPAYDQKRRAGMSTEESPEEPRQYFKVAIADMHINHYTHVKITGEAKSVRSERDGDTHIQISDGSNFIVAECIPKLPCSVTPDVGQSVTVRGISRYDRENRWYEVHPVEEIEIKK